MSLSSEEILRERLEEKFGVSPMTIGETARLSESIYERTGQRISPTTIQRFFKLVRSNSTTSKFSLDVLSQYVGVESFAVFSRSIRPRNKERIRTDKWGLELLSLCLQNHQFGTVLQYLEKLPHPSEAQYPHRIAVAEVLGLAIRRDRKARKVLLPELAKTTNGRFYFYETFVDLDYLNDYYADALDYYLKYLPFEDKKLKERDLLFTTNVQFRRSVLYQSKKSAAKSAYRLTSIDTKKLDRSDNSNYLPLGRTIFTEILSEGYLRRDGDFSAAIKRLHQFCAETDSIGIVVFLISEAVQALYLLKEFPLIREIALEYLNEIDMVTKVDHITPILAILKKVDSMYQESNFAHLGSNFVTQSTICGCESHYSTNNERSFFSLNIK